VKQRLSLGSAKRDRTLLNIIVDMSVPLCGTFYGGIVVARTHSCAASQLAVGF